MKHNTSELTGALLDAAVAKVLGFDVREKGGSLFVTGPRGFMGYIPPAAYVPTWSPSTDWAVGGPLIESEHIELRYQGRELEAPWIAMHWGVRGMPHLRGPTPLIAAMRALVAAKLGGEVELP